MSQLSKVQSAVPGYDTKDFETYFQKPRPEMLRYVPQQASVVLDVGCADGGFGQLLKAERDIEVWGVEPTEKAALVAAQKLDKVIQGFFDSDINLPKNTFDCIIFNDVLEHLVDPYSALVYSKELLREGGVIVASIPNVRYFDNIWNLLVKKDWQYIDYGILDRTHLRFFTQKSILSTFETLGLSVRCIEGINPVEQEHPGHSKKFNILNKILFNSIKDMRYLQFAVTAIPQKNQQT